MHTSLYPMRTTIDKLQLTSVLPPSSIIKRKPYILTLWLASTTLRNAHSKRQFQNIFCHMIDRVGCLESPCNQPRFEFGDRLILISLRLLHKIIPNKSEGYFLLYLYNCWKRLAWTSRLVALNAVRLPIFIMQPQSRL